MSLFERILVVALAATFAGQSASAQNDTSSFDDEGTLQIPAQRMAQSDFLSPAFKKSYAQQLKDAQKWPQPPTLNASPEEWDKYNVLADRYIATPRRDSDVAHYAVDIQDTSIAGVHVDIVTPKTGIAPENAHRVLLNLHGGGFFMGSGGVKGQSESIALSAIAKIKVISIDYRQAPRFRYPAASEDVAAVYSELLKRYQARQIGIYGCSAGGTLVGQSVAWFQAKGLPTPGAVGIFCAAPVRFGLKGDSTPWGVTGLPSFGAARFAVPASAAAATRKPGGTGYMEGVDTDNPQAYPGSSDAVLAKFPPVLLMSGTRAGEMSAVIVAHARFLKLGVDSSLYLEEGGVHGAPFGAAQATPEAGDFIAYLGRWFDRHLAR